MKNFDLDEFWENLWKGLAFVVVIAFIALLGKLFTADHSIRNYYLSNYDGTLKIMEDIDWDGDKTIELDRSIAMDSAIVLVERLNNTLRK